MNFQDSIFGIVISSKNSILKVFQPISCFILNNDVCNVNGDFKTLQSRVSFLHPALHFTTLN